MTIDPEVAPRRRFVPLRPGDLGLLVPMVLAVLAAQRGRATAAAVLGVVAVVAVLLRIVAGDLVPRTTARVGAAAQRWLTWLVLTGFWAVVVLPVWAARRLLRVDARRERRHSGTRWVATPDAAPPARTFAAPEAAPRTGGPLVLTAIGAVVVLLAVDVGIGLAWQGFTRSSTTEPIAGPLGLHRDGTFADPRADEPALAGSPWASEQLRDLQHLPTSYWPFELYRPLPFRSPSLNLLGWERRSYQVPRADRADVPVIAFFGGSTTFGEGQRDEHTIPSEIARLAEREGTPVRVLNYGQRAWSSWQEAVLFEQLSSDPDDPDHPDLVVFYDGWNDVTLQAQDSTAGWPTHFAVDAIAHKFTGTDAGQGASETSQASSLGSDVAGWYTGHSTIFRGLRAVRSRLDPKPRTFDQTVSKDPPDEVGRRGFAVYERAADFVVATAQRRGVRPYLFWQPARGWRANPEYAAATERVAAQDRTENIVDALDGRQDVYLDDVHTNEEGARIVAERMWETLRGPVHDAG